MLAHPRLPSECSPDAFPCHTSRSWVKRPWYMLPSVCRIKTRFLCLTIALIGLTHSGQGRRASTYKSSCFRTFERSICVFLCLKKALFYPRITRRGILRIATSVTLSFLGSIVRLATGITAKLRCASLCAEQFQTPQTDKAMLIILGLCLGY